MSQRAVGRFAPSPTGDLHAGSVLAALGSWLFARRAGGAWRVRIEDVDGQRTVAGAAQRQLATLHALGLVPDGDVWVQSHRHAAYAEALMPLLRSGAAFECWCSRADLAGRVHRACVRAADASRLPAVRLRVPDRTCIAFDDAVAGHVEQCVDQVAGDFVLRRADGMWAYQFAVVVDDAAQGVTQVVRGGDLLDSTPRQVLLQRTLGLPTPRHAHLPLLRDAHGRKLSKSAGDAAIDAGKPLNALADAWQALGQAPLPAPSPSTWLAQALDAFDPARIPPPPAGDARATPPS